MSLKWQSTGTLEDFRHRVIMARSRYISYGRLSCPDTKSAVAFLAQAEDNLDAADRDGDPYLCDEASTACAFAEDEFLRALNASTDPTAVRCRSVYRTAQALFFAKAYGATEDTIRKHLERL